VERERESRGEEATATNLTAIPALHVAPETFLAVEGLLSPWFQQKGNGT